MKASEGEGSVQIQILGEEFQFKKPPHPNHVKHVDRLSSGFLNRNSFRFQIYFPSVQCGEQAKFRAREGQGASVPLKGTRFFFKSSAFQRLQYKYRQTSTKTLMNFSRNIFKIDLGLEEEGLCSKSINFARHHQNIDRYSQWKLVKVTPLKFNDQFYINIL